jgi:20S proteasome alpha/beta subunit
MEAASRGSTVACMTLDFRPYFPNNSTSGNLAVIVMLREKRGIRHASFQKKYWTLEEHKIHRIDTHAILVTTGLCGDGLALAKTLRRIALNHRLSFGEATLQGYKVENMETRFHVDRSGGLGGPVSLATLARDCASLQHELTRTSGARPLGVHAILVGLDPMNTHGTVMNPGEIRLFQSESGGILEEYQYCSSGRGENRARAAMETLWNEIQGELSNMKRKEGDWKHPVFHECYSHIMKRLIKNMGLIVLKADRESIGVNADLEEGDDRGTAVDVYVLKVDTTCRGNLQILCAQDVAENDLDIVSNLF